MRITLFLLTILSVALHAEPAPDEAEKAEARKLAAELVEAFGIARKIPATKQMLCEAVDRSSEGFTPEEVALLKEYMCAEVDTGFLPLMTDVFARYFTLEELKAIRDKREPPALRAKVPGWKKFCEKEGADFWREVRIRAERKVGARIAEVVLQKMGVDGQIPAILEGLDDKVREIQKELDLTPEQTEQVRGFMAREFKRSFRRKMAEWFSEYFTDHELKALRDEREFPGWKDKMAGLTEYTQKKAHDWGYGIGRRAVEEVLDDDDE